ncbi:hypothetical protein AB4851_29055 [Burkholderia sp. 22PA0099]|uniref:hypothetical protein n=1 Tax=unclassified Burkholderia TaxID=2613784 RepID=UPI0039C45937
MPSLTHPASRTEGAGSKPAPNERGAERSTTRRDEKQIDKALEDTFPASDPPATGGVTRIDPVPAHQPPDRGEPGSP